MVTRERELLDLLYQGMYWLNQATNQRRARRASPVFKALLNMGLLSEVEYRRLPVNHTLITLFLQEAYSLRLAYNKTPIQSEIDTLVQERTEPIILMAQATMLSYPRLFGPRGYSMLLTELGDARVMALMEQDLHKADQWHRDFMAVYRLH